MNSYEVCPTSRNRWAYEVRCNGRVYARCDSYKDGAIFAKAMNMAVAVSRAAALEVKQGKPI